jgi:hypothetical protein
LNVDDRDASLPAPVIYALFGLWACFVVGLIVYAATHVENWWPKEKVPDWPSEERRTTESPAPFRPPSASGSSAAPATGSGPEGSRPA